MKPVLIIENSTNSLMINEKQSNLGKYVLGGIFTEFGVVNRNNRVYQAEKFLPCLDELNERITNLGVVYGEFDHPDVFDTSLSRASHIIRKAEYVAEHNRIEGEIQLLNTYWGKESKALVDDGLPIFVSSRAAGITESNGTVTLKKLFTYDIVADPGFASAKMGVKSLNESLGFDNSSNFRIYEMSDESKINDLFNMNENDFVTKTQLTEYSQHLVNELAQFKNKIESAVKKGNVGGKELEKMMGYYEELNTAQSKVMQYLNMLSEKVQILVDENKSLNKENKTINEKLEKVVNYAEYLAVELNSNIDKVYTINETVNNVISYAEYIVENLDNEIDRVNSVNEKLDKSISYTEYVGGQLDKSIAYTEYVGEQLEGEFSKVNEKLDMSISYTEHVGNILETEQKSINEKLDMSISYSEYISEQVEMGINDNIAYSEYIAEKLEKTIDFSESLLESIKSNKINENVDGVVYPSLDEFGLGVLSNEEETDETEDETEHETEVNVGVDSDLKNEDGVIKGEIKLDIEVGLPADTQDVPCGDNCEENKEGGEENFIYSEVDSDDEVSGDEVEEEEVVVEDEEKFESFKSKSDLSASIDKLIEEAKKRKVSESTDLNFLTFLNQSQVDAFSNLSKEDQETIKLYISEKSYFSSNDVLRLMTEALRKENETIEERIVRMMPESHKAIWSQMNESQQKSILAQSRFFPSETLMNESQIEHFWATRNMKKNESVAKKLLSEELITESDFIPEKEMNAILERFKRLG